MSSPKVAAKGHDVEKCGFNHSVSSFSLIKSDGRTDDVATAILDVLNYAIPCVHFLSIVLVTPVKSAKDVKSGYKISIIITLDNRIFISCFYDLFL